MVLKKINKKSEYMKAQAFMETLLKKVGDNEDMKNPDVLLLDNVSDLIADYEDVNYPIATPSLLQVIKLRMDELGLSQADLSRILEIPTSRVSEYLKEKREITLDVAKKLHKKLDIDGNIILQ